jgi:hypothetical protein
MIDAFEPPAGCRLLSRWQAGDREAAGRLKKIFDTAIAGGFDADFARPARWMR